MRGGGGPIAVRVLGPLEIVNQSTAVKLGGTRRRTLLAVLVAHRNDVVSVDRLVEEVWRGSPPPRSRDTLQAHIAHLRRALTDAKAPVEIERRAPGYLLRLADDAIDAGEFEALIAAGRDAYATHDLESANVAFAAALGLWTSMPFGGVDEVDSVHAERIRLEQLRRDAIEQWGATELNLGRSAAVVPALEELVQDDPWRERAVALLMLALYRMGRQVDALAAYQRLRSALADELGLVPSPELQALEADILRHERATDREIGPAGPTSSSSTSTIESPTFEPSDVLPFVGREAELAVTQHLLSRAREGDRLVALLRGEAGAGKTRLARELALKAPELDVTVLAGRCSEEPLAPYEPFIEAITGYLSRVGADGLSSLTPADAGELVRVVPGLGALVPTITPEPTPVPGFERLRLFEAIVRFIASAGPVLLVLDDLHWADRGTLALLRHLLRAPISDSLLVVVAMRALEAPAEAMSVVSDAQRDGVEVTRIDLEGLSEHDVSELAHAALHFDAAGGVAVGAVVWRATEGNPFFVREVLRDLAQRPDARELRDRARPHVELDVPATVRDALDARLGRLPQPVQEALQGAAVLGDEFDISLLAMMSDVSEQEALAIIEAATKNGIVSETSVMDRFRFTHALIRRCVLDQLGGSRRARLHHRAGAAIEDAHRADLRPYLGELAHHFAEAATDEDIGRAIDYARRAGDRSMELFAYEDAARHYRRALDGKAFVGDADVAARCDLLLALGDALNQAGDTSEAGSALEAAAELAIELDDAERLAGAALAYGGYFTHAGNLDVTRAALLEQALARLGIGQPVLRARVLARLAEAIDFADGQRAIALSDEAVILARATGDERALAVALHASLMTYVPNGDETRRVRAADELLAIADGLSDTDLWVRGLAWRLVGALELADLDAVRDAHAKIEGSNNALLQALHKWGALGFRAMLTLLHGDMDAADSAAQQALEVGQRVHALQAFQNHTVQQLVLRWYRGGLPEMVPLIDQIKPLVLGIPAFGLVQPWLQLRIGDLAAAEEGLDAAAADGFVAVRESAFWAPGMALAAEVCAGCGRVDHALVLYEQLRPLAGETIVVGRSSVCLGAADRHLGLLAATLERWDDADRHFTDAEAIHERLEAWPLLAITRWEHASMLAQRSDPADQLRVGELAAQAARSATELGMGWLASAAGLSADP